MDDLRRVILVLELVGTVGLVWMILPPSLKMSIRYEVKSLADAITGPYHARKSRRIAEFQLRYDLAEAIQRIEAG